MRFSEGRRGGLLFANLKFVSDRFVNGCEEGEDAVERSVPGFRCRFAPEDLPLRTGAALSFIRHQVEEAFRMLAKMDCKLLERRLTGCRQASGSLLKPGAHASAPGLALIFLPAHEAARKQKEVFFIPDPEKRFSFVAHGGADEHDGTAFRESREAGRDELDGFSLASRFILRKA